MSTHNEAYMASSRSRLHGRALITGGSSGLGLAFAYSLASRGIDLVLVARDPQRLSQAAQQMRIHGVDVETLAADLTCAADLAQVKERLLNEESPVTIFVNNAGAGLYASMITRDATQLRQGAELMGLAPMELGGAAAAAMADRHEGVIINTASVAALAPMGAYSAIKEFIRTWSDSLAIAAAPLGVQVVTFLPGWVRTQFHARTGVSNSSIPNWVWLDADRVVADCLRDVERGKTRSVPSKRFKAIAFVAKHAPASLVKRAVVTLNKGRR
ncbi:SDR family NAD(P)-dependent oxidoreductase [Trueperella sp. LYQ143]|uniref:SDR family NAD(P)-dependent oxidoreductase n=1 Tax=unclassified Trueperella TaxID=2630174 RepID=UPI0039836881